MAIIDLLKPTLIRIIIRFGVWGPINTSFMDPRMYLLFMNQFLAIRILRFEFFLQFSSNPREYLEFRDDFFDSLLVSGS